MKRNLMPPAYLGREQAYIKHTILKSYLQRLFMIVGRQKELVVNYVDCFAGPWNEGDEQLRDTSIAISLEQMRLCRQALHEMFGKDVRFRALYIERDAGRFARLKEYLSSKPCVEIETHCLMGDYTKLISEILTWQQGFFTFFFVDPMGWQQVVGGKTMEQLLCLPNTEFLINLMYDFINRFVEYERHGKDMVELFGEQPEFDGESPEVRQQVLLNLYRSNVNHYYGGRTAYVPVEKPGTDKVLYFLVYLTRSAKGIEVFKTEAEKMEVVQRITQQEVKLRMKSEKSGTDDLFGAYAVPLETAYEDNRYEAKAFLLSQLSYEPTLIDIELWASWLEQTNLYPTDFQIAMKELVKEGKAQNLDADVKRRSKNIIKPVWAQKSERWALAHE